MYMQQQMQQIQQVNNKFNNIKKSNQERKEGQGGDLLPWTLMEVRKEEEGPEGVEKEGTKCNIKGNLPPSKSQSSKENMTLMLTWSGNKKWMKFLAFIELVIKSK